ncbi:MAG: PLP-dependent aminotransferase family protein [Thermomicrobiales bacterium]|nr:PLP-dependent aminotransferase family protein [Thermomicrobiales bacterium]
MNALAERLDRSTDTPLFRQLADALAEEITTGVLSAGSRLPSERELAEQLGLSRTTAMNAYRELEARGMVRGQVGRGTYVCAIGHHNGDTPFAWQGKVALSAQRTLDHTIRGLVREDEGETISFAAGSSAQDLFPLEAFRALTNEMLDRHPATALGLGPTEGQRTLREAIAARYRVRPEQVLILTGSQQGLDLIARCLLDPGDVALVDRPGYLGAIQTFHAAGVHPIGWDVRRADPDELEHLLQRYRPKLIYTNPTFNNPTGRTLPIGVRQEMLALAARYRVPIVEDEPYRDLYFRAAPPKMLRELDDQQLVIQLGTFSKALAPGLRLGWLIAPDGIVDQLTLVKQRSDLFGPGLSQLVVAELLRRGVFERHMQTLRTHHIERYRAAVTALERVAPALRLSWSGVEGGVYLWIQTSTEIDTRLLATAAREAGVAIVAGESFYADGAGRHEFRLCFARQTPERIGEGIRRLARVIATDDRIRLRPAASHPLI